MNIAAALARRFETRLLLVHVDQLHRSLVSDPIIIESAALQTRCELDREAQRLRDSGTDVKGKVLAGSAFDQLVTTATNAKARLIVIGALGHGLARRLLVGSVAERTAESSPIPTLVVRPGGRLASWIRGEHAIKILVGYDFSAASDAALDWVNQLGEIGKFQATVLYTNWPPDEARGLGYEGLLPEGSACTRVACSRARDPDAVYVTVGSAAGAAAFE